MATRNDPLPLARTPLHALHVQAPDCTWVTLGDGATPPAWPRPARKRPVWPAAA